MPPLSAKDLVAQFGAHVSLASSGEAPLLSDHAREDILSLGWPELDAALPDGGLPRGVVELRAPRLLGGATSIALAAVRAAQLRDREAWGGWVDARGTLFAPGVAMAGIDLSRLLVVRPTEGRLLRTAITAARAAAFSVLVVELDAASVQRKLEPFVRKLSLLAGESGTTVLLLTDAALSRGAPLPTALRLELSRKEETIEVRIGKDRHGRVGRMTSIPFDSRPQLSLSV